MRGLKSFRACPNFNVDESILIGLGGYDGVNLYYGDSFANSFLNIFSKQMSVIKFWLKRNVLPAQAK